MRTAKGTTKTPGGVKNYYDLKETKRPGRRWADSQKPRSYNMKV